MKLNKAEKFVKAQIESGKTRNGVREAIFEKLGTWNFPPEYEKALVEFDPTYDNESLIGIDYPYLDDYICKDCGGRSETCFCGESIDCIICQKSPCECVIIDLPKLPDPNSREWNKMVDEMKLLDQHKGMISSAMKIVEDSGRGFWESFDKWKKEKGGKTHV